jgi:predicted transglutaminase-like cysteine proteinase
MVRIRIRNYGTRSIAQSRYRCILLFCLLFAIALASCTKAPQIAPYVPPPPEKKEIAPPPELSKRDLWQQLVIKNRYSPFSIKLATVNTFFNRFDFIDDKHLWGREDYWATLPETLNKSAGDCEDITIAKYFTLKDLDIPEDRMRLTYVFSAKTGKPHIVLTVLSGTLEEPLVLDTTHNYLIPVSRRTDLIPVYSFNEHGYWIARSKEGWKGKHLGGPDKISSWWELLQRMKKSRSVFKGG